MDGLAAILIWQTFARGESMSEPRSNPELRTFICRSIGRVFTSRYMVYFGGYCAFLISMTTFCEFNDFGQSTG